MREIIDFLEDLSYNNNKIWFDANKDRYLQMQGKFNDFVSKMILAIGKFDGDIKNLTVKDCTYRIYRDMRFSKDKSPYKTHFGAYFCKGGKKSGYAGYYFHIEAKNANYLGNNILAAGAYCPQAEELKSIREEIYSNGEEFDKAVRNAKGFSFDGSRKLSKMPKGFPEDANFPEYLKLKDYALIANIDDEVMFSEKIFDFALNMFKNSAGYIEIINKAICFARN